MFAGRVERGVSYAFGDLEQRNDGHFHSQRGPNLRSLVYAIGFWRRRRDYTTMLLADVVIARVIAALEIKK
jgi:hypothetical protein